MGYRIDIDHDGCINCGVCMDVCPVQALDMTRPDRAGVEAGLGRRTAHLDDGVPDPGRRVHRLRDLHPGVPGRGHGLSTPSRPDAAGAAPGSDHATRAAPTAGSRWSEVTRESLKPTQRLAVRATGMADARASAAVAGLATDGRRRRAASRSRRARPPVPPAPTPAATSGLIAPGPLRRRLRGRRRGQSVPVRLRLDLHRAVRGGLPSRHARRADRDPDASSGSPPSMARCRPSIRRRSAGAERVAIVGGGPAACRPPTTSPGSATASRSSRRCPSPAA